jgi:hypothetical protein
VLLDVIDLVQTFLTVRLAPAGEAVGSFWEAPVFCMGDMFILNEKMGAI